MTRLTRALDIDFETIRWFWDTNMSNRDLGNGEDIQHITRSLLNSGLSEAERICVLLGIIGNVAQNLKKEQSEQ